MSVGTEGDGTGGAGGGAGGEGVGGDPGLPEAPCVNRRPHPEHVWFAAREGPGHTVAIAGSQCLGLPAVVATFEDHREVTVVRCYEGDESGPCARVLMYDAGEGLGVDLLGWRVREHDHGGFAKGRVWSCPVHAGAGAGLAGAG